MSKPINAINRQCGSNGQTMPYKETAHAKICIIEDDAVIRRELAEFLTGRGYTIMAPEELPADILNVLNEQPGLILLDIGLVTQDGITLCRRLKQQCDIPVIFVTGQDTVQSEISGFQAGADDYIRKPYHPSLLLLRIQKLLMRTGREAKRLTASGVTLDLVFSQLTYDGLAFELSKKEQQILFYLFLNHPRIVGKDELIGYLWDNKLFVDENILNVNLSRIRKRLKGTPLQDFIITIPDRGYKVGGM